MATPDIAAASILGERGVRYKRNTLAASLIATVLYLTRAPLGEVSLFGVSLSNVEDKEAAGWMIFFAILSYQWVMLAYYGWTDWRIWQQQVRRTYKFSPRNVAFWMNDGVVMWDGGVPSNFTVYTTTVQPDGIGWGAQHPGPGAPGGRVKGLIPRSAREQIRWRLTAFFTLEFGLPFLWGLACLYLALSKILG